MTAAIHHQLVLALLALGAVTFVSLLFVVAPYGRHVRGGWGPTIPDRIGWIVMESPALLFFGWLYSRGSHCADLAPLLLLALWLLHYGHRVLVFPFLKRGTGKRMPVLIAALAIGFNVLNASVNAPQIAELGVYPDPWIRDARFLVGVCMFLLGFAINFDADRRLFALRAPGSSGYSIPRGGLFERISCPNYFGEIVEWLGWSIATWSLGGLAFALYTIANLAPRAMANHAWYRREFPDYPKERKALLPFVV